MSKKNRFEKDPPASKTHYEIHVKNSDGLWRIGMFMEDGEEDKLLMFNDPDIARNAYMSLLDAKAKKSLNDNKLEFRIAVVRVWGFPSGYIPNDLELVIEP